MDFIQSRNYQPSRRSPVCVIVIHTAEMDTVAGGALNLANYFAGTNAPVASAHYIVGPDQVIETVHEADTAWAAPPLNDAGIQIEHIARARYTATDWSGTGQMAMLARSAELAADICHRQALPVQQATDAQLAALLRGDTSHRIGLTDHATINRVARALNLAQSDHWDPGPDFPWATYLPAVLAVYNNASNPLSNPEADMPLTTDDLAKIGALIDARVTNIAVAAATATWNRFKVIDSAGHPIAYQVALSTLLTAVPADASRDAVITAAIAAVPAETVADLAAALTPPVA